MKIYLLSLGAGLLVGVVYSLLQVRSPAPPLGGVGRPAWHPGGRTADSGGQAYAQRLGLAAACDKEKTVSHLFGQLPGRQARPQRQDQNTDQG